MRASFSKKRKKLYNSLRPFLSKMDVPSHRFRDEAAAADIDLGRRAETLSAGEFYTLSEIVDRLKDRP